MTKPKEENQEQQGRQHRPGPSDSPSPLQADSPVTAGAPTATRSKEDAAIAARIGDLNREFGANLPASAMASGAYTVEKDSDWDGREFDVPDGKYRTSGGDWIFTIKGKKLKDVARAAPPDYGGEDVVIV